MSDSPVVLLESAGQEGWYMSQKSDLFLFKLTYVDVPSVCMLSGSMAPDHAASHNPNLTQFRYKRKILRLIHGSVLQCLTAQHAYTCSYICITPPHLK